MADFLILNSVYDEEMLACCKKYICIDSHKQHVNCFLRVHISPILNYFMDIFVTSRT